MFFCLHKIYLHFKYYIYLMYTYFLKMMITKWEKSFPIRYYIQWKYLYSKIYKTENNLYI